MKPSTPIRAALAGVFAAALAACGSAAPKPLSPKNISAPIAPPEYLPPGLSSTLKAGQAISLAAPTPLLLHPERKSEAGDTLPPGTLVRLKSRVLNTEGPWWLVDAPTLSGWIAEPQLLRR